MLAIRVCKFFLMHTFFFTNKFVMGVGKRLFRLEKMLKISGTAKHLQLLVWVDVSMAWSSNYYYFKIVSFGNLLFGVIYDINQCLYHQCATRVSTKSSTLDLHVWWERSPLLPPKGRGYSYRCPMDVGSPESDT